MSSSHVLSLPIQSRDGDGHVIASADGEDVEAAPEHYLTALDTCVCALFLVTAPGMPRQAFREELVELCIWLIKHLLDRVLFPFFAANGASM